MPEHKFALIITNFLTVLMHLPIVVFRIIRQLFGGQLSAEWIGDFENIIIEGNPVLLKWNASNFCMVKIEGQIFIRASEVTVYPSVDRRSIDLIFWSPRNKLVLTKVFSVIGIEKTAHSSGMIVSNSSPKAQYTKKLNLNRRPQRVHRMKSIKLTSPKTIKPIILPHGRKLL